MAIAEWCGFVGIGNRSRSSCRICPIRWRVWGVVCFLGVLSLARVGCAEGKDVAKRTVFPVVVDDKMGFIDGQGNVVIEPRFTWLVHGDCERIGPDMRIHDDYFKDRVTAGGAIAPARGMADFFSPFLCGASVVCQDQLFGYVDESGVVIAEPQYSTVSVFQGQVGWVHKDDGYALIDRNGRELAGKFGEVGKFGCGIAPVRVDGKWGFIDTTGRLVAPPSFDHVGYHGADPLSLLLQQIALVVGDMCSVSREGKYALICARGELLTSFQYDRIRLDEGGLAVCTGPNGDSVISSEGDILFENVPYPISGTPTRRCVKVRQDDREGLLGRGSDWLQPPRFRSISEFVDGVAIAVDDDGARLLSCDGEPLSRPFSQLVPAADGAFWFRAENGKWGVRDRQGVSQPPFCDAEYVYPCARGMVVFELDGKYGLAHQGGTIVHAASLDNIHLREPDGQQAFSDGFAVFEQGGKQGLLSIDGQVAILPAYDWLDWKDCCGLRVCRKGALYGYVSSQGEEIVAPQYDYSERFRAGLGRIGVGGSSYFGLVVEGGKWGYVDSKGHFVWKPTN